MKLFITSILMLMTTSVVYGATCNVSDAPDSNHQYTPGWKPTKKIDLLETSLVSDRYLVDSKEITVEHSTYFHQSQEFVYVRVTDRSDSANTKRLGEVTFPYFSPINVFFYTSDEFPLLITCNDSAQ